MRHTSLFFVCCVCERFICVANQKLARAIPMFPWVMRYLSLVTHPFLPYLTIESKFLTNMSGGISGMQFERED